jgi:hypothetical protein
MVAASVAVFALTGIFALFAAAGEAQSSNAASANSSGHSFGGTAATFGSAGFSSHESGPGMSDRETFSSSSPTQNVAPRDPRPRPSSFPSEVYAIPVPYPIEEDVAGPASNADDSDADYQGGPTIFDRRGFGASSYVPPRWDEAPVQRANAPSKPSKPTTIVFKDGRQMEVESYAIVGHSLLDIAPGQTRKIALANVDIDATRRENNQHGVNFSLPPDFRENK